MAKKIEKTNAARLLDRAKIHYELLSYEVDENDLAATHVAEQLGEPIERVFKTLVLRGDRNGLFVCVVPGDKEVNLKVAARVSGNKSADLIPMKELLPKRHCSGDDSEENLLGTFNAGLERIHSLLYAYVYVLGHYNGVIHHKSHRKYHGKHGKHVD